MPHDHHHHHVDPDAGDARVAWAVVVNMVLTLAQVVGGLLSGSLALIADDGVVAGQTDAEAATTFGKLADAWAEGDIRVRGPKTQYISPNMRGPFEIAGAVTAVAVECRYRANPKTGIKNLGKFTMSLSQMAQLVKVKGTMS